MKTKELPDGSKQVVRQVYFGSAGVPMVRLIGECGLNDGDSVTVTQHPTGRVVIEKINFEGARGAEEKR